LTLVIQGISLRENIQGGLVLRLTRLFMEYTHGQITRLTAKRFEL